MLGYIKKLFCSNFNIPLGVEDARDKYVTELSELCRELSELSKKYISEEDLPGYRIENKDTVKEFRRDYIFFRFYHEYKTVKIHLQGLEATPILIVSYNSDTFKTLLRGNWDEHVIHALKYIIQKYKESEAKAIEEKKIKFDTSISKYNKLFGDKPLQG
jgi:hypothetical protein